MTTITALPHARRVRRLAATLYAYAALRDLVLLYPVYTLLFADTGLSVWRISTLFVIWSVSAILLELPSGALADALSRRLLLTLAPLVTAAGFALWVLVPSYPAFAVGFLLWGAGGSLASGALEALVHTELDRLGAAGRYARIIGRARSAETLGVLASIVLAAPVLALGGYPAVGAASVLTCLLAAAVATRLPEHRDRGGSGIPGVPAGSDGAGGARPGGAGGDDDLGWRASLRAGLAEAHADRAVRAAVVLVAAVAAVWGVLDEYTPLLARDTGVAEPVVPLLLLLTWIGVAAGGLLAPAGERLGRHGYAGLLAGSAAALGAGALLDHPVGFVLVGAAFCGFQLATVLADARLQARITGPSRATVTSLAGMATDGTTIVVYAGYGLAATAAGHGVAFAVAAVPYLVVALLLAAGRLARRARRRPAGDCVDAAAGTPAGG